MISLSHSLYPGLMQPFPKSNVIEVSKICKAPSLSHHQCTSIVRRHFYYLSYCQLIGQAIEDNPIFLQFIKRKRDFFSKTKVTCINRLLNIHLLCPCVAARTDEKIEINIDFWKWISTFDKRILKERKSHIPGQTF